MRYYRHLRIERPPYIYIYRHINRNFYQPITPRRLPLWELPSSRGAAANRCCRGVAPKKETKGLTLSLLSSFTWPLSTRAKITHCTEGFTQPADIAYIPKLRSRIRVYVLAALRCLFPGPVVAFHICSSTVRTGNSEVRREVQPLGPSTCTSRRLAACGAACASA